MPATAAAGAAWRRSCGGKSAARWARANGWSGEGTTQLIADAAAGQEVAVAALGRAGTALGQAISSVTALLDIDLVVLSGSLAAPGSALWKPMNAAVATHARLSFLPSLRVVPSDLGENAILCGSRRPGVHGAGLILQRLSSSVT